MEVSSLLSEEPARSSRPPPPKRIAFELLLDDVSKTRARIPLRILVNLHDTTESIITTVKNFYGIYDGHGVSFEDVNGNILIARYENLVNNSMVYVRTVAPPVQSMTVAGMGTYQMLFPSDAHRRTSLGESLQMAPPIIHEHSHSPSRPASRLARKRSTSPSYGRGRRSASQQKPGSIPASRNSSANGSYHDDAANGYSDSDAGRSSITGSKRARSEQFPSTDISLENVLQDGRRGKTLFDSSTLPLFVPPQVPITASQSSISPQRRSLPQDGPSPFQPPSQNPPVFHQPLPSPQSHCFSAQTREVNTANNAFQSGQSGPQHRHRLRDRSVVQPPIPNGRSGYSGHGVLPTPDPTVASCISDEDVARQLIALGDMSNFSHGRTSNSTLDDGVSGAADAASLTGATSESDEYSDDEGPRLPKYRKLNQYADEDYEHEAVIKSEMDEYAGEPRIKKIKTKVHDGPTNQYRIPKPATSSRSAKDGKIRANSTPKLSKTTSLQAGLEKVQTSPAALGQIGKASSSTLNFQHQLGIDEEDLSSQPRCQRCRKSKKGCDRQRPCQRCKDAGIGIEGCVSEDEGNGRKGRYGRHMGVPVKKGSESLTGDDDSEIAGAILTGMASAQASPDKSKKRKR